jgi:hypothetical protein
MAIIINTEKLKNIEKLPLFSKGNLVYEKSGHVLTHSGNYYICSQKCKKKCSNAAEQNLKINDFERKFVRQMRHLSILDTVGTKLFYKLDGEAVEVREETEEELKQSKEVLSTTLTCIKKDAREGRKINNKDIHDLVEQYFKILKISFPVFLINLMQSSFKALTSNDLIVAQAVSAMIEKLYVQDNGKISKIKLNGLGNYFFQYLETNIPDYLKNFKIPIIERIEFPDLKLSKVILYFKENSYRGINDYSMFASEYSEKKQKKGLYSFLKKLKLNDLNNWVCFVKDQLWQMPLAQFSNSYHYDKNGDRPRDLGWIKIKKRL